MSEINKVLDDLAALHPKLIDLGLDRTFEILDVLGNPHENLPPVLHIAGTNGKGSTAALMRAIANAAGLRCHVYTSPHLCRFNERIRLADTLISDDDLVSLLSEVRDRNAGRPITFFEVTTAAAFLAFSRVKADLVILETGLGGLLDSTNVISRPAATIITPVARDHEHFLGSDITEIGRQKAGIFKSGAPAIIARQSEEARLGIEDIANQKAITTHWMGEQFDYQIQDNSLLISIDGTDYTTPLPSLSGAHQAGNAALAAAALHYSGVMALSDGISGIGQAVWPGRVQKLEDGSLVKLTKGTAIWLDGAHNAHGAHALVEAMADKSGAPHSWSVIIGALNTRPVADFLAQIRPLAKQIVAITIPFQEAALPAEEIAIAAQQQGLECKTAPDIQQALSMIADEPQILICGSLYLAGHILTENGTLPD
ncbi:MAG: bifunctional folylpolyglutamate synthase/dihydrofolate synthase [Candidatus Puniceispirillaceae bacterium]